MAQNSKPVSDSTLSWLNLIIGLWLLGLGVWTFCTTRSSPWNFVRIAGGLLLLGVELRKWQMRRSAVKQQAAAVTAAENDGPIRSLVLLLDGPRDIKPGAWVEHLGQALGVPLNTEGEQSTSFVMPIPHPSLTPRGDDCFMLVIPQGAFWIFHVKSPYVEDVKAWAAGIRDQRLREAAGDHGAWISVDLLSWNDGPFDRRKVYGVIGKCLAALAGPDVRAVLCPELERCNEFDPSLLPVLSGGDPLSLFANPTFAPVIHVKDDNEQLEAAVAEARDRWPEFVALFQKRDPASDRPFIVKAPFTDSEGTEFMWVSVTALDGDTILGTLANQPHHLMDYHEGQPVTVAAKDINDWLCADDNDQPLGGWTQKVLMARTPSPSPD